MLIAAAAFVLGARAIYEPDLWYHVAQGREDVAGRLVRTNLFSFVAPDYPQTYTSWLFDVSAYLAWKLAGGAGIQLLQVLLLALSFALIYRAAFVAAKTDDPAKAANPASAGYAALAVLLLGIFVIEPRAIPRPHLVSFVGLALVSLLVTRATVSRRAAPLLWAVPVVAVWSNFHVESVFGAALVGLFACAELVRPAALPRAEARRAIGVAILCALATLATPYGTGLFRYLAENTWVTEILDVAELQPPYLAAYRAFFVYLGVWAIVLLSQPKRLRLWEVVVGVGFAALGLRFLRLTPLVFFVTAPMLASRVAVFIAHGLDGRAVLVTSAAAAVAISRIPLPTLATTWRIGGDAMAPASFFSARAVEFARAEALDGPLFNSNNLGGFLAWSLYPQARIFQDSRFQAYPFEHLLAIRRASPSQADWNQLVARVDWAMLSLARPVELSGVGRFPEAEWATVFWDDAVAIVVRRTGPHAGLAAARDYTRVVPGASAFALAAELATERRERLIVEAQRNQLDNPTGFTPAAVLCLSGDTDACARLDRLAIERPALGEDVRRVQEFRKSVR